MSNFRKLDWRATLESFSHSRGFGTNVANPRACSSNDALELLSWLVGEEALLDAADCVLNMWNPSYSWAEQLRLLLGVLKPPSVVRYLVDRMTTEKNIDVRREAASLMADIGGEYGLRYLNILLDDSDPFINSAAVVYLRNYLWALDKDARVDILARIRAHENPEVARYHTEMCELASSCGGDAGGGETPGQ